VRAGAAATRRHRHLEQAEVAAGLHAGGDEPGLPG
jgi:hypothetical protein